MADALALLFAELQFEKHIEVKIQDEFGFMTGVSELAASERPSNRKKMVGDALHCGNNHGDTGQPGGCSNETRRVEHAVRTEKRTAAELESGDLPELPGYPACAMHDFVMSGRGMA